MRSPSTLSSCITLLLAAAGSGSPAGAQRAAAGRLYVLTRLCPGASHSVATSVDEAGWVTGVRSVGTLSTAFRWSPASGAVDLPPAPGWSRSSGASVNRSGTVVGSSFTPGPDSPTLWTGAGAGTALAHPFPGSFVFATAINHAGTVVGFKSGAAQSFIWDPVNGARDLATLGLTGAPRAMDLNDVDQIAGSQAFGQGFLFDLSSGVSLSVGTLGGDSSSAFGLNNASTVVGQADDALGVGRPYRWRPGQGLSDLGQGSPYSGLPGAALAVSDHEVVVGRVQVQAAPAVDHAFLWTPEVGMRDLNELVEGGGSLRLTQALDVSNRGWIVGSGLDTAANQTVAVLLRPK